MIFGNKYLNDFFGPMIGLICGYFTDVVALTPL